MRMTRTILRTTTLFFFLLSQWLTPTTIAQEKPIPVREQIEKRFGMTVEARHDQPYAGNTNRSQMVDLFLPKTRADDRPLPVVVFIHGGGWSGGHRNGFDEPAARLASSGKYATVSVGYRLSGEAKWPAQIHDCKAAIRWIRGQAKDLNLDPDRIGATGSSAGGHLVTLLGLTENVKELEGDLGPFTKFSSRVTCVVNLCGPSDLTTPLMQGEAALRDDPAVSGLIGGSLKDKADVAKAASPLTYVTTDAVPIMTVHGTQDLRVNFTNAEKLHAALKKAGASSMLIAMTGAGHGIPIGSELAGRIQQFWDLHLRNVKSDISAEPIADTPRTAPPEPAHMQSIFNGKDLTGWDGDPRLWSAKDGVLRGETTAENPAQGNTFIIWKDGTTKDFELRLSFRCNATNNSGIQYRSKHITDGKVNNQWVVRGYQHELRNEIQLPSVAGFIYDEGGKRGRICLVGEKATWEDDGKKVTATLIDQKGFEKLFKLDGWNDVIIIAKGNHIQHYLNNTLILDFTDKDPERALKEGILALQLHAGKPMWVEFKNVRLNDS